PVAPLPTRTMTERRHHVADSGQMREERVVLEHKTNGPAIRWNERPPVRIAPRLSAGSNRCVRGSVQARSGTQNRRLPAAGRSKDREDFSRVTCELDVQRDWTGLAERDEQGAISHGRD